ncbi:MAG: YitT family protein [Clostridiaceae bacterium]
MSTNEKLIMILKKMPSLFFGLLLYAVAILLTLYSKLGVSPWDVFHVGVTNHVSLTFGQVSILTGFAIVALSVFLGVIPGLSSIFNMIFIGVFIDLINSLSILSTPASLPGKIAMLLTGIFMMGWATFFYLRVEMGAGPRDGLMEGLVKKFDKPVWMIRSTIELMALALGFAMGGPVGLGTLLIAFTIGFSVQLAFRMGGYSSENVQHLDLKQMYKLFRENEKVEKSSVQ